LTQAFAASSVADRAEQALAPHVAAAGYDLLLCEWSGVGGKPTLWVYIERPDGDPIGIKDCQAVNNAIADLLDVEDLVPGAYVLNVSSPGVERPLKRAEHFAAQLGKLMKIRTWEPISDRRNFKGKLLALDDDVVTIQVDNTEHRIPLPAIERAHLVWTAPEKGQKKGGSRRKKRGRS
jgi:ribosome maturation factor RimP